jgi:hypothetical protein
MDPFLEGSMWKDFHHELISEIRHQLVRHLGPKFVARVELRVYIERVDVPAKSIEPDVYVTAEPVAAPRATVQGQSSAAVAEPYIVQLPQYEEVEEAYIAIYDAEQREVITVIEVLSPGNKRPGSAARRSYLEKREAILRSWVNLVEFDLLRGGERMPTESPLPPGDYFALVRRAEVRARGEVYHWGLRDRLPPIPIPLTREDPDVVIDLAAAFSTLYDRAGYDRAVSYDLPVEPPLSEAEADWVAGILGRTKRAKR